MYLDYWNLIQSPFQNTLAPSQMYLSESQEESIARMLFVTENRFRMGMILGDTGAGKSLMIEFVADTLRREGKRVFQLDLLHVQPEEILHKVYEALKLGPVPDVDDYILWRNICDRMDERFSINENWVFLIDHIDQVDESSYQTIERLIARDIDPDARLSFLLGCHSDKLKNVTPRIMQEVQLRIDLEPFSLQECSDFCDHQFKSIGNNESPITNGAIARLHKYSAGNPKQIAQLAEMSLVAAAGQELPCIDAETVERVVAELAPPQISRNVA